MYRGIEFPKPLPTYSKKIQINDIGLTQPEIVALTNLWRQVKTRFRHHSMQIFFTFFTENEELIERFRDTSGKFNLSRLHQHPAQMLNLYGTLIESGLNDSGFVSGTMTEISQRHKQSNVPFEDIKMHTTHVQGYLLDYFVNIKSSTLDSGITKLSDIINSYHTPEDEDADADANADELALLQ